jgi:Uma2 family endonuclease
MIKITDNNEQTCLGANQPMTDLLTTDLYSTPFPDHTQLPDSDGTFVKNFQEHPQSILLTDSIGPVLQRLHPDGFYAIGQDCGIYWRETDPPEKGAEAPDWFYVPGVPPLLDGQVRRSYVMRREFRLPLIALEFASGDGSEERDDTPLGIVNGTQKPGKFWVYEQIMRIPYYGIYLPNSGSLELYTLEHGTYRPMTANARGHYEITPMEVELGVWRGSYQNQVMHWLRWWDLQGNLLPTGQEAAQQAMEEKEQAQEAAQQAQEAAQQALEEKQQAQEAAQQAQEAAQQAQEAAQQALEEKQQATAELNQERLKRQQLADKLKALTPEQLAALGIATDELDPP